MLRGPKVLGGGGGVKIKVHQNHLSETLLFVKSICTRFHWPNEPVGYMKGSHLEAVENEKSAFN